MIKKISGALCAAMIVALFAGCGGTPKAENDMAPEENQTLTMYLDRQPDTLDISRRSGRTAAFIAENIYEGLVRTEYRSGIYETVPGDAESWTESDDGLTWTFKLHKDAKWQDGQPVTAEDYVYSLRRSASSEIQNHNDFYLRPLLNYEKVKSGELPPEELGAEAKDDRTLVIRLGKKVPSFLRLISSSVYYPQRQDAVESMGDAYGKTAAMCNGPFCIESREGGTMVLVKNENYLHSDEVKLQKITFLTASSEEELVEAAQQGSADILPIMTLDEEEKLSALETGEVREYPTDDIYHIFFNCRDDIFGNENIRKAFSVSIDREELTENCFDHHMKPAEGWITPAVTVGELNYREEADREKPMNGEAIDMLLKGMEEEGLGDDTSALNVTLSLGGNTLWYKALGDYLSKSWNEALGVNVTVELDTWDNFTSKLSAGEIQFGFMKWGGYYNDPYDTLSVFAFGADVFNTGFSDKDFDSAIEKALDESKDEKIIKAYAQAENILVREKAGVMPLVSGSRTYFINSRVKGFDRTFFDDSGLKNAYIAK